MGKLLQISRHEKLKPKNRYVEAGDMMVKVGGSSVDLPLQKTFRITDTTVIRPAKRGFYANYEIK